MFTIDLADQRAVVTGSSTGIGRATVIMFAEAGADVGIHYVENEKDAEQTAAEVRARGRRAVSTTVPVRALTSRRCCVRENCVLEVILNAAVSAV